MRNFASSFVSMDDRQVKGILGETAGAAALIVALNVATNWSKDKATVYLMRLALPLTLVAGLVSIVASHEYFKERAKEGTKDGKPVAATSESIAITNSDMQLMAAADGCIMIAAISACLAIAAAQVKNKSLGAELSMLTNSLLFFATTQGYVTFAVDVARELSKREMNWFPKFGLFSQEKQQPTSNPEMALQSAPTMQ